MSFNPLTLCADLPGTGTQYDGYLHKWACLGLTWGLITRHFEYAKCIKYTYAFINKIYSRILISGTWDFTC